MTNTRGYTLVELIVVMAIFIVVIMISLNAFELLLTKTGQQMKSAESNMEGIVGLEMLRYDIEHVGYGLPWSFQNAATYKEIPDATATLVLGVDPTAYRDLDPVTGVPMAPRAIIGGFSTSTSKIYGTTGSGGKKTNPGTDYLVVKSVMATLAKSAKRWTYTNYSTTAGGSGGSASYLRKWNQDNDLQPNDIVTSIRTFFKSDGTMDKRLIMNGASFSYNVGSGGAPFRGVIDDNFKPTDQTASYLVYTVDNEAGTATLGMPYNRADFYVKVPDTITQRPGSCNSGTGILYKAVANQRAAGYTEYPLIDCVGDFQVLFNLDMNVDGVAGTLASPNGIDNTITATDKTSFQVIGSEGATATTVQQTMIDPSLLRQRLKQVQLYLLAHEGGKDRNYTYPADSIMVGETGVGRSWSSTDMSDKFGADWRNYRWRVYRLMVRPKNLF
jgi:prepilin-type N-terminal cleavage/methylation domain-containing protein